MHKPSYCNITWDEQGDEQGVGSCEIFLDGNAWYKMKEYYTTTF